MLKRFFAAIVCVLALAAWTPSETFSTATDNPKAPVVIFLNTYTGYNADIFKQGEWATVDLKPYGVPADAKAAFLSGILIVTGGGDIMLAFRGMGDTLDCANYLGQALEWESSGGIRSTQATVVPLNNGQFQVCFKGLSYPDVKPPVVNTVPSYGMSLSLQGFWR